VFYKVETGCNEGYSHHGEEKKNRKIPIIALKKQKI